MPIAQIVPGKVQKFLTREVRDDTIHDWSSPPKRQTRSASAARELSPSQEIKPQQTRAASSLPSRKSFSKGSNNIPSSKMPEHSASGCPCPPTPISSCSPSPVPTSPPPPAQSFPSPPNPSQQPSLPPAR